MWTNYLGYGNTTKKIIAFIAWSEFLSAASIAENVQDASQSKTSESMLLHTDMSL